MRDNKLNNDRYTIIYVYEATDKVSTKIIDNFVESKIFKFIKESKLLNKSTDVITLC